MTGETKRAFMKHSKYGVVKLVEFDETGYALAARDVSGVTACKHNVDDVELNLNDAAEINEHKRDWDKFEPECSDPAHWLREVGELERDCAQAEAELEAAKSHAKVCKERYDECVNALRMLVRDATNPKKLPLFEKSDAA